jgi:hypothetical protein
MVPGVVAAVVDRPAVDEVGTLVVALPSKPVVRVVLLVMTGSVARIKRGGIFASSTLTELLSTWGLETMAVVSRGEVHGSLGMIEAVAMATKGISTSTAIITVVL